MLFVRGPFVLWTVRFCAYPVRVQTDSRWEENLPQEESKDHVNPNSQGTSSGYAEETVAGLSCRHKDSPQQEVESPLSLAFWMKHLVTSMPSVPAFKDPGATNFVTGSYHPRSSIQLMKEHMDTELQGLPPLMQPPLYTPAYRTDDPLPPLL